MRRQHLQSKRRTSGIEIASQQVSIGTQGQSDALFQAAQVSESTRTSWLEPAVWADQPRTEEGYYEESSHAHVTPRFGIRHSGRDPSAASSRGQSQSELERQWGEQ